MEAGKNITPILMTEEYWINSQLSIARYYGQVRFNGYDYIVLNKEGKDLWECTHEANKAGRDKAIEPGEPADLVRKDFREFYRKFGRERFIEVVKGWRLGNDALKKRFKELIK